MLLSGNLLLAQKPEGVWITAYAKRLKDISEPVAEKVTQADTTTTILEGEAVEVSPVYQPINALFHFKGRKMKVYGLWGNTKKEAAFKWKNGALRAKLGGTRLHGALTDTGTLVLSPVKKKLQGQVLVLEKLKQANPEIAQKYNHDSFVSTYWKISSDTSSWLNGVGIHFADSVTAYLIKPYKSKKYVSWGSWEVDRYDDRLFLHIRDMMFAESYVFYLYNQKAGGLLAEGYEQGTKYDDSPPRKQQFFLEKKGLLTEAELEALRQKLVGKWFTNHLFDSVSLVEQEVTLDKPLYELELRHDGSFGLKISGKITETATGEEEIIDKDISGRYTVSPTAEFIELTAKDEEDHFYETIIIREVEDELQMTSSNIPGFRIFSTQPLFLKRR